MTKALLKNHVSKSYLNDPQRFSQLYNNTLFGGRPVILPEKLQELDTTELKTRWMSIMRCPCVAFCMIH